MRFAATTISILPDDQVALSGLQRRERDAETLGLAECKLKIAWVEIDEQNPLLFFLADLLFFPEYLANKLEIQIAQEFNIGRSNIVFSGTHNHSGPALGFLPWESENQLYQDFVFEKITPVLKNLPGRLEPVRMEFSEVLAPSVSVNRRKRIRHWRNGFAKRAVMVPNPSGPITSKIKSIKFIPENGKPTAFFSYASHPVFNRSLKYSSDYPGLLSSWCREKLDLEEAFWFQGFGGDLRPDFRGKPGLKARIKEWFYGPEFAIYTQELMESFCLQIIENVQRADTPPVIIETDAEVKFSEQHFTLSSRSGRTKKELHLQIISLGPDLKWITANGELFCCYENLLPSKYFPISCTAGTIGYVPDPKEVKWGGYEVQAAAINNGMDGPIAVEALEEVLAFFSKLGAEAG